MAKKKYTWRVIESEPGTIRIEFSIAAAELVASALEVVNPDTRAAEKAARSMALQIQQDIED